MGDTKRWRQIVRIIFAIQIYKYIREIFRHAKEEEEVAILFEDAAHSWLDIWNR